MLDESGRLRRPGELPDSVPAALRGRIVDAASRRDMAFVVAREAEHGAESEILLTQQDIREFQLAKGAIRAREMVLQSVMGIADDDVAEVLLAGAFGTFIDRENARRVGLVPQVPLSRVRSVGNAAGVGARLALVSKRERREEERIARTTEHVQLSGLDEFEKMFAHAMKFPEPSPKE